MSRTFSRATRLGQRMDMLGFTVAELRQVTGIDRWKLNDYLLHGKAISPIHMQRLCSALSCSPESLIEPQ